LATIPFVNSSDRIWIVFLFLLFAALSLPMLLKAFMFRVVLSDEGDGKHFRLGENQELFVERCEPIHDFHSGCLRIETNTNDRLVLTGNIQAWVAVGRTSAAQSKRVPLEPSAVCAHDMARGPGVDA
jgi:hypothetical protein